VRRLLRGGNAAASHSLIVITHRLPVFGIML
jgi:hypothetical protein